MSTDWMLRAACRGADTHLFFPGTNDSAAPALAYCKRCDVRAKCLEDALARPGCDCGIRGGMSERERRREARNRRAAQVDLGRERPRINGRFAARGAT